MLPVELPDPMYPPKVIVASRVPPEPAQDSLLVPKVPPDDQVPIGAPPVFIFLNCPVVEL